MPTRRAFLKSVGASTALAALSQFFPLKTATEVFAQGGPIEKKDLKVGFIPITCATPIIMAHPMGFYGRHGLNVEVIKTAGWAVIRDKTLNKEYDAAHMLSPMPLAITLGAGSTPIPYTMPAVENINGQAITLAVKHKDRRDPKSWKGMKFAVPVRLFDAQLPAALLRRRARARSRPGHPDPCGAAARNGRQPARRQHRRLPGARPGKPARRL
jgi:nitrate/nitrite transport system substrate-binding protein